jgi:hypothetical protein
MSSKRPPAAASMSSMLPKHWLSCALESPLPMRLPSPS